MERQLSSGSDRFDEKYVLSGEYNFVTLIKRMEEYPSSVLYFEQKDSHTGPKQAILYAERAPGRPKP